MSVTRTAVKVPMKKLLAVATLVGTASGGAIAVSASSPEPPSCAAPIAVDVIEVPAPPVREVVAPEPVQIVTIQPLALGNGWPACGNLVDKAGRLRGRPCPPAEQQAASVVVRSTLVGVRE